MIGKVEKYLKWMRAVPSVVVPSGNMSTLGGFCNIVLSTIVSIIWAENLGHPTKNKAIITITSNSSLNLKRLTSPWPAFLSCPSPELLNSRAPRLRAGPIDADCLHEPEEINHS